VLIVTVGLSDMVLIVTVGLSDMVWKSKFCI